MKPEQNEIYEAQSPIQWGVPPDYIVIYNPAALRKYALKLRAQLEKTDGDAIGVKL